MMNIDDIVFDQAQLDTAIERGCRNICLCDNSFTLQCTDGVSYMAIGNVKAVIRLDKGRRYNISFDGFEPTVIYTGGYTGITEQTQQDILPMCGSYGSYGSFGSYGSGSGGSFAGSGMYSVYGWSSGSYTTSGSAAGSYATSYSTSYRTSFVTSYTTSGSALITHRELYFTEAEKKERRVFYAAGYGLNLI